jgi:hypothetical protein
MLTFVNNEKRKKNITTVPRGHDMNGRSKMQGVKNWMLPKDKCKPVLLRLSLAGNLEKPLFMSLYGTEWRERGYGLGF